MQYIIHQSSSEFDYMVTSFDGRGSAYNYAAARHLANQIERAGYGTEVALDGEPTATFQPIGVWMRQADYLQYREIQQLVLASAVRARIIDACDDAKDLRSHAETIATWAFDDVMAEPVGQGQPGYWQANYGGRVQKITEVTCRQWLANVPALRAAEAESA